MGARLDDILIDIIEANLLKGRGNIIHITMADVEDDMLVVRIPLNLGISFKIPVVTRVNYPILTMTMLLVP